MKNLAVVALAGALLVPTAYAETMKMSHAHMGHVMSSWKDTPNNAGLLPVAMSEAEVAAQHAGFAAKKPSDLGWMKTHTLHVMHAIDPSVVPKGPGAGYGVIKAATGVSKHIGFAAASDDASGAVKVHAEHIATSAENTIDRAQQIMAAAQMVMDTQNAGFAAARVREINSLAAQLLSGVDANGDGAITWQKGEGGLGESNKHMAILAKAEGMM